MDREIFTYVVDCLLLISQHLLNSSVFLSKHGTDQKLMMDKGMSNTKLLNVLRQHYFFHVKLYWSGILETLIVVLVEIHIFHINNRCFQLHEEELYNWLKCAVIFFYLSIYFVYRKSRAAESRRILFYKDVDKYILGREFK